MRTPTMLLLVLSVGLMAQSFHPVFAEAHELVSPKAITGEEFHGIHHVLDILGNTNVRRLDTDSMKKFEEYIDIKSAVNNRPNTARVYPNRLNAPRKVNKRLF